MQSGISEFRSALALQRMIVHAIVLRNMNAMYATSRLGYFMAVVDPLVMIVSLYLIRFYLIGKQAIYGIPLALFIVTGYLTYYMFRHLVMDVARAARARSQALMFPQVTPFDGIIAGTVVGVVTYSGVILLSFTLAVLIAGSPPQNILLLLTAIVLTMWLGASFGLIVGVFYRFTPVTGLIINPVLRAGTFLSGAMYLASELPTALLPVIRWNPVFHTVELMRVAWFHGYASPIVSIPYPAKCALVMTLIGMAFERSTRARQR